jgi:hypothetical protein
MTRAPDHRALAESVTQHQEDIMVSSTQQFERIRKRKATTNGKRNKREHRANGTPKFAVHVAGYDAKAADAKPAKA